MIKLHYKEIARHQDIPLDPDWDKYRALEEADVLRCYTVIAGEHDPNDDTHDIRVAALNDERIHPLIGYTFFIIGSNMHYQGSRQAVEDVLYLHPDHRGTSTGIRLIKYSDEQLKEDGCQLEHRHVKSDHNHGVLLERLGYDLVDLIYQRRLDK